MLTVTPLYGSVLVALIIFLAYRVTTFRRGESIALGDDQSSWGMKRAIRAHANAVENIPAAILLLLMLELNSLTPWLLHLLGVSLVTARIIHAQGLSRKSGPSFGRFYGTILTWLVMLAMVVLNLILLVIR